MTTTPKASCCWQQIAVDIERIRRDTAHHVGRCHDLPDGIISESRRAQRIGRRQPIAHIVIGERTDLTQGIGLAGEFAEIVIGESLRFVAAAAARALAFDLGHRPDRALFVERINGLASQSVGDFGAGNES